MSRPSVPVSGPEPDQPLVEPPTAQEKTPWVLLVALAAVGLEAVVLVFLGVAELVALDGSRIAMGLTTALFFLGYGALLSWCVRSMWRGETWGRSIVVMGQLIQLGTAWSNRDANPALAATAAVVALVVLAGVFHPASLRTLDE